MEARWDNIVRIAQADDIKVRLYGIFDLRAPRGHYVGCLTSPGLPNLRPSDLESDWQMCDGLVFNTRLSRKDRFGSNHRWTDAIP